MAVHYTLSVLTTVIVAKTCLAGEILLSLQSPVQSTYYWGGVPGQSHVFLRNSVDKLIEIDKAQWMSRVIELQIVEQQRLGLFVNEDAVRRINAMYAEHTGIFALEPTGIFEHQPFEIAGKAVGTYLDEISAIWKQAADLGKRVVLYFITPTYQIDSSTALMNTAPPLIGYVVRFTYVA